MKVKSWRITAIYQLFTIVSVMLPIDGIAYVSRLHTLGVKVNIIKLF